MKLITRSSSVLVCLGAFVLFLGSDMPLAMATSALRVGRAQNPLKVFILAGQSNMVGMASLHHLELLVHGMSDGGNCPCEYQTLWNGTGFRERDDVYMQYGERKGKLTPGTGFASKNNFGPEVGFGWVMGDAMDETIVIIKAAYGGRSLAIDFRPPMSGEGNYPKVKPSHYGRLLVAGSASYMCKIATSPSTTATTASLPLSNRLGVPTDDSRYQ